MWQEKYVIKIIYSGSQKYFLSHISNIVDSCSYGLWRTYSNVIDKKSNTLEACKSYLNLFEANSLSKKANNFSKKDSLYSKWQKA